MFRELARARRGMRDRDVSESKHLLWELVSNEPTVLQCFGIVEATCMAQGLFCRIDGERCGDKFQKFVDKHFVPFCRAALRAFFTYGFVPWRVKTLQSGDEVPEVIPHGTFHWYTEVPDRHSTSAKQQRDYGLVGYRVQITAALEIKDEDVQIFEFATPGLDISVNSMLYATVPSPLAHILTDYKNLRCAQIRKAHADSWNTTAKLICSFKPTVRVQEDPTSSLMDFADDGYYQPAMGLGIPGFAPLHATNLWTRDAQIRKQFEGASTHQPDIFTLPRDHDVAQQPMLVPCEDLDFLMAKFQRDVCAVMGIPEEMVRQAKGQETVRKTMASGRLFTANMTALCRRLQELLADVYLSLYGKDNAEFVLMPMPRLEVETIEDLKILFEIGAITPDTSLQLSQILVGEELDNKRRRTELAGRGRSDGFAMKPGELEDAKRTMQPKKPPAEKGDDKAAAGKGKDKDRPERKPDAKAAGQAGKK